MRRPRGARRRPPRSSSTPDPMRGRAEVHRMDEPAPRLGGELLAQRADRERRLVADERAEDRLVVLGEDLGERHPMGLVVGRERHDGRRPTARRRGRVSIGTTAGASRRAIASTTRRSSAPARSILLTKISVGTRSRRRARNRSGVWGWTPSTAETTRTAPSSTPRTRSTSAMKSGWPGVSTRLTARSPTRNEATADRIVMPRSRSSSSESVWVVPASTLPT